MAAPETGLTSGQIGGIGHRSQDSPWQRDIPRTILKHTKYLRLLIINIGKLGTNLGQLRTSCGSAGICSGI